MWVGVQVREQASTAAASRRARWPRRGGHGGVLAAGGSLGLDELQAHCRRHLAGFKVPKQLIVVEEMPRNPSGKVLKRKLRAALAKAQE